MMNEEEKGPEIVSVAFIVHEGEMARMERVNRRMAFIAGALIVVLILSNLYWILRG